MNLEKLSIEELERLLELPDSLRKTMIALIELGEARGEEVAKKTGRLRASESRYLNRLIRLGYVKKRRMGRKVYFWPSISLKS